MTEPPARKLYRVVVSTVEVVEAETPGDAEAEALDRIISDTGGHFAYCRQNFGTDTTETTDPEDKDPVADGLREIGVGT